MLKIGTIILKDGVNAVKMHENPSLSAKVILSIPTNDSIVIIGQQDDWNKIVYHGKTGYILNKFIKENFESVVLTGEQRELLVNNIQNILTILDEVL